MEGQAKTLRAFHNKIKGELIQRGCHMIHPGVQTLLDIGVGRGGDIMKWHNNQIPKVVGIDIEYTYIREAIRRFNQAHLRNVRDYRFYVIKNGDSFYTTLEKRNLNTLYDMISCQFCLHYFASSEECLHEFFSNIARVLKPGGVFIGTVPNGDKILNMLGNGDEFSNEQVLIKKMFDTPSACGDAIQFSMTGTLYFGENMISHEYLVYENVLRDITSKYGLTLVEWKSFEEHYKEHDFLLHDDTQKASFVNNTFIFKRVQGESLH